MTELRQWRMLALCRQPRGQADVIIGTSVFTRQVRELLPDGEYRKLQVALVSAPTLGSVIRGSGGLRKMRWVLPGKGKRGGVRVIYYWSVVEEQLLMLLVYAKSVQDELSPSQLRTLRELVEEEYP